MKFFEEQEKARAKSRQLVFLFMMLVVVLELALNGLVYVAFSASSTYVGERPNRSSYDQTRGRSGSRRSQSAEQGYQGRPAPAPLWAFEWMTLGSLALVLGAGAARGYQLKKGGGAQVAKMAGGEEADCGDPLEKRLVNVVEEMSLASGTPQPRVYVMRAEGGINAFAAGWSPEDAVICVTRGCLEKLSRDELQGVVAHEFSHIFNADMRVNIRAMGMLFGLYVLAITGREILNWSRLSGGNKLGKAMLLVGLGFMVFGWIGQMLGHALSAAISRQREYLADASAVQFTRNAEGIGGALRKIGGASSGKMSGSAIAEPKAMALSHMFFGAGSMSLADGLLATHPPLDDRIERVYGRKMDYLAPQDQRSALMSMGGALAKPATPWDQSKSATPWDQSQGGRDRARARASKISDGAKAILGLGAAANGRGGAAGAFVGIAPARARDSQGEGSSHAGSSESLGLKTGSGVEIPESVRGSCSDKAKVEALCLCLVVASQPEGPVKERALTKAASASKMGLEELSGLSQDVGRMPSSTHVALIDLCAGTLKGLPEDRKAALLAAMSEIAKLDGSVSLREQALFQVAKRRMGVVKTGYNKGQLAQSKAEAANALAWVAKRSCPEESEARSKFESAAAGLASIGIGPGDWEASGKGLSNPKWSELDALAPMQKPALAKAIARAAGGSESGMDAAKIACALMGCPAPYAEVAW